MHKDSFPRRAVMEYECSNPVKDMKEFQHKN